MYSYLKALLNATLIFALSAICSLPVVADNRIRPPKVGDHTVWDCKGPWSHNYDLTVIKVNDGVVTYRGDRDGEDYLVLKHVNYLGTTLWKQQGSDKHQEVDSYYFSGLEKLQLGSVFKGPVPAKVENDAWVWEAEIGVGKTKRAKVPHIGEVDVVTVTESKRIYHGTYHTKMQSLIAPSLGVTVRWKFSDPFGEEVCWLTKFEQSE